MAKKRKDKAKRSRRQVLRRLQHWLMTGTLLVLGLAMLLVWAGGEQGRAARWLNDWLAEPERLKAFYGRRVGVVAGHMGFDTGAICPDGLTEAETVQRIAEQLVQRLRRAGAEAELLAEYDERLNGYVADVLISIHADSCQIVRSGFKVAHAEPSAIPAQEEALVDCLRQRYAEATGLPFDAASITEDMTGYHAFKRVAPGTPAAIIETGFLGGDRQLLTQQSNRVVRGILDGLTCFLRGEAPSLPPGREGD